MFSGSTMTCNENFSVSLYIHNQAALLPHTTRVYNLFLRVVAAKLTSSPQSTVCAGLFEVQCSEEGTGRRANIILLRMAKSLGFTSVASFISCILRVLTHSMRSAGVMTEAQRQNINTKYTPPALLPLHPCDKPPSAACLRICCRWRDTSDFLLFVSDSVEAKKTGN